MMQHQEGIIRSFICFGEMLWDLLPEGASPGGAPMNVAYHLHRQGMQVTPVSRIGQDELGKQLVAFLRSKEVAITSVQIDTVHETGKVYAHMDNRQDVRYEIVAPVAWDFISWDREFEHLMAATAGGYFIFGSLAVRHDVSRETLAQALPRAGIRVLDINLRAPHYTRERLEWLLSQCDILKLNETELQLLGSWYLPEAAPREVVISLSERFQIPEVIVTMGSEGALLYRDGQWHRQAAFPVTVVDTIGSGDAFLAGYLSQRNLGRPAEQCLSYAAALGALVATFPGACPDYDPADIDSLLATVK
ncbi:carbohydrate kinase [Chitinophaga pendula]|uniref:carbohydrate kinase family protein n=1 Tax=Chitinophaga TaxID=79328 RepID=UPI000BAED200|nr:MULTISPECIES: carbohydrate kinase [Chitinophaga]ASZ12765.1 carbohydrate kinase [Chitinophaga sp. MD30]UCJ09615.1 carbohydrate kinase [Chitinophaga pendula]